MADRFPLILNTSANQIQEIASGDQLDLSGNNIANAGIITASSFSGPVVASGIITAVAADIDDFVDVGSNIQLGNAGIITATGADINGDLDVDGHTNLDNASIAGVTTFADNAKAIFGTGGDLEIYHTGSGSVINDVGSGSLHLRRAGSNRINIQTDDVTLCYQGNVKLATTNTGINVTGNAVATGADINGDLDVDGHTNLDNVSVAGVSTFAGAVTTGDHVTLSGQNPRITFTDSNHNPDYELYGSAGNFKIWDSTNNVGRLVVNSDGHVDIPGNLDCGAGIDVTGNATVSGNLSVGGVLTYEDVTNVDSVGIITARDNIRIISDSKKLEIGAGQDLQLYHTGSNSYIDDQGTGALIIKSNILSIRNAADNEQVAIFNENGAVEFYYDNSAKLATRSNGITVTGYTYSDGVTIGNGTAYKYLAGSGNQLQMYHTGGSGNGYINNTQGTLLIGGPVVSFTNQANNAFLIRAVDGGTAELYFNANKKLETTNTGVTVTGTLAATAVTGDGSGLTGIVVGISTEQVTPSSNVATLDLTKDDHKIVASGTYTITCTGGTEADNHTLRIENSGTANVGFSSYFKFPSGGTPSLPTTNGAISLISFTVHKVGSVGIATVLLSGASVNYS